MADATHLHIKVLEDILNQKNSGKSPSEQQQVESHALGMASRLAGPDEDAAASSQDLWAACLVLQADVDLAVVQMCNMHM